MIEPKYFKQIMDLTRENVKAKETVEKFLSEYSALVAVAEAAEKFVEYDTTYEYKKLDAFTKAIAAWRELGKK